MKILYKPLQVITALAGAKAGQSAFQRLWARLDDGPPPVPTNAAASLPKVIGAAALEAATMAAVAAAIDRASARWFHHLTGIWPGADADPPQDD
ncbi:MAG: DUF4235 domain-containing protein [Solirubrobacteraceae bacterium]